MDPQKVFDDLEAVRKQAPLVHNIINYVAMNFTANVLLALGASPIMAHAEEEMEEMVKLSGTLVLNIGTLSEPWLKSMKKALVAAKDNRRSVVLDPVGVGATAYRTKSVMNLLDCGGVNIIRGNASEILALAGNHILSKGVDSLSPSEAAIEAARELNRRWGAIICVSGATDYIVEYEGMTALNNGHHWMTKITAMGCAATSVVGAFSSVERDNTRATISAMATMSVAGEIAAEKAQGPGSFQVEFLDAIASLTLDDFVKRLNLGRA